MNNVDMIQYPIVKMISKEGVTEIKMLQELRIYEEQVIIKFADYVPYIRRGFMADIEIEYKTKKQSENKSEEYDSERYELISNALLVYVNRVFDHGEPSDSEYIFYR